MWAHDLLGLPVDADERAVKRAYAARLKVTRPDDDPAAFQRLGLEWAWRLMSEPRRMASRYARCAAVFADVTLRGARARQEATR